MLIDGSDIGIGQGIYGIELIETDVMIGGQSLTSGQILLTLEKNDSSVGSNSLSVEEFDVFILDATQTTLGSGTTVATAAMLVEGLDVNLDANEENLGAIALLTASEPSVVALPSSAMNYTEGDGATVIDTAATVSDADSSDFDTGTLTVDFTAGGTANDRLAIRHQGTGAGQIGVSGSTVSYQGTNIGTFIGGTHGSDPLIITLNANADATATQALARNITYENVSENPATTARTVRFVLSDGDGGTSDAATQTINVIAVVDHTLTVDTSSDTSDGDTASIDTLLANKGADGFISLREAIVSLREAIVAANNTTGADTIQFNIAGVGPHTIQPTSALPLITDTVTIDGSTQSGFVSTPVIELDGTAAGINTDGLRLQVGSDGSIIRSLAINRFQDEGIDIRSDNNLVAGNHIGLTPAGTGALGNTGVGILLTDGATNNTIGGIVATDRNVISGNSQNGILINATGNHHHQVQGNYIGTDVNGTTALGNTLDGIRVQNNASSNAIGGTAAGAGNLIAHNTASGIVISGAASRHNALYGNVIHTNTGLGIDLNDDGVTVNDANDSDTGPNNLQNYPVLISAHTPGTRTAIRGALNSIAATSFRLGFFANAMVDGSGHGEGERFLGSREVTTHASTGNATFTFMLSGAVAVGEFVTATATNLATHDTSEFALNVTAVAGVDTDSDGVLDVVEDRNLDGDNNPTTRWWAGIIAAPHSGFVRAIIWIILANIRAGFICLRVLNLSVVIIPTHYRQLAPPSIPTAPAISITMIPMTMVMAPLRPVKTPTATAIPLMMIPPAMAFPITSTPMTRDREPAIAMAMGSTMMSSVLVVYPVPTAMAMAFPTITTRTTIPSSSA